MYGKISEIKKMTTQNTTGLKISSVYLVVKLFSR